MKKPNDPKSDVLKKQVTGKVLGVRRVPAVKGQAIPAYGEVHCGIRPTLHSGPHLVHLLLEIAPVGRRSDIGVHLYPGPVVRKN